MFKDKYHFFFHRLDGTLLDLSTDFTRTLGTEKVKLDVSRNSQSGDDPGLAIISLQFKNGKMCELLKKKKATNLLIPDHLNVYLPLLSARTSIHMFIRG